MVTHASVTSWKSTRAVMKSRRPQMCARGRQRWRPRPWYREPSRRGNIAVARPRGLFLQSRYRRRPTGRCCTRPGQCPFAATPRRRPCAWDPGSRRHICDARVCLTGTSKATRSTAPGGGDCGARGSGGGLARRSRSFRILYYFVISDTRVPIGTRNSHVQRRFRRKRIFQFFAPSVIYRITECFLFCFVFTRSREPAGVVFLLHNNILYQHNFIRSDVVLLAQTIMRQSDLL